MKPETDAFVVTERRGPLSREERLADDPRLWQARRPARGSAPAHVAPCVRLRPRRPGADTRLIQDDLGHRNIQHTVRYTATNRPQFERLWRYSDKGSEQ